MSRIDILRRAIGKLSLVMGRYNSLKHIDAHRIERLVFVCRGNVCRSPYGEAATKLFNLSAISCGVEVTRSAPAEEMAIRAALLRNKDLSGHMSQSIYNVLLTSSDCLVAMDPTHLLIARDVASRMGCQITLAGLWRKSPEVEIADPYGKPLQTFSECFDEIDEALDGLVDWIRKYSSVRFTDSEGK